MMMGKEIVFDELNLLDPRSPVVERAEVPTPHKLAVLILIEQFIRAKKRAADNGIEYLGQSRRKFCMMILTLLQFPDMPYNDLYNMITSSEYEIEDYHLKDFRKVMDNIFTFGIEALFDFCDLHNLEKMSAEQVGVGQYSIAGLFFRRIGITLERLSFCEMLYLKKKICSYYKKGVRVLMMSPRRYQQDDFQNIESDTSILENILENDLDLYSRGRINLRNQRKNGRWSWKQIEIFVREQCNLLENNEINALTPSEMQNRIEEIMFDNPFNPQVYFLDYLNQLRLRDIFGARKALHRAFDRCPILIAGDFEGKVFQYFSINTAIYHANFQHDEEALAALNECIMLAQDCNDKECLDMVNVWCALLTNDNMNPIETNCAADIQDEDQLESISSTILLNVKFGAQNGHDPLELFNLIEESDALNMKIYALKNITDSLALRAALWSLYGGYEISTLYAQMVLHLKKYDFDCDFDNTESVCKVLSSLGLWFYMQNENNLSNIMLKHAEARFPRYPYSTGWIVSECHVAIQTAIFHCNLNEALKWCNQLILFDAIDGYMQRAAALIAMGRANTARKILIELQESNKLEPLQEVRILILMAHTSTSNHMYTNAVDYLMQALELSSSFCILYENALITIYLAQVLLRMGLPQKALQAVKNSMDEIYINGGAYDCAKTDFIFVQCLLASCKDTKSMEVEFLKASPILEAAADSFYNVEAHAKVLDVYLYLAQKSNELGLIEKRNLYACKFNEYYKQNSICREYLGSTY